jgi:hypothetical protein
LIEFNEIKINESTISFSSSQIKTSESNSYTVFSWPFVSMGSVFTIQPAMGTRISGEGEQPTDSFSSHELTNTVKQLFI